MLSHNAGSSLLKRAGVARRSEQMDDPVRAVRAEQALSHDSIEDVLLQPGVTHVIVLEHHQRHRDVLAIQRITDDRGADQRAPHAHPASARRGLKIYGGTLTPFKGAFYWNDSGEARRQKLNEWIRTSGEYDGVVDFDAAVRDSKDPVKFRENFQPGDWLHANDAGYKAMADAVDLALFATTVPAQVEGIRAYGASPSVSSM